MLAAAPTDLVRGACPGVATPMRTADGLLLRVRLPGGTLTPGGARSVATVAERFGSGTVELTSRANLQIRGVAPEDATAAARHLTEAALAHPEPRRDERRDVLASPLAGHDSTELIDLSAAVRATVHQLVTADRSLDHLPPKFRVVLDGGGTASVRSIPADVALGAVRSPDGTVLAQVALGHALDDPAASEITCVPIADVVPVALAAAHLCAGSGERMATLAESLGPAKAMNAVLHSTGVTGQRLPAPPPSPASGTLGPLTHPNPDRLNIGAAPLLGRTSPDPLRALARLAEATGASLRLTPGRSVVLAGIPRHRQTEAVAALTEAGFSADPADPAHLLSACVGQPGCSWALADTAAAARDLLDRPNPPTTRIHLAGCEKRCGADATRVVVAGEDGRFEVEPW